ncbi:MAG TPA: tetratricopeptide repeat protein [Vicinamibacterales bacterium]|nr:tetratricopeptide repeat protein [Vicinamibacterales bacterium]
MSFRWSALCVFLTALAIRVVHVWQMRDTLYLTVLMGDSRGYDAWAQRLAGGDWVGSEVFYQAPLYPYFLGLIYALVGRDLLIVRLVQASIGALSCVAVAYGVSRLVSRRAGLVAGVMLALYPPAIFFDGLIQKSVLDVLLISAAIALLGTLVESRQRGSTWLALGATMAALSLTRENALLLVAVVALWAIWRDGHHPHTRRTIAPYAAGLAIVLLPVVVRNFAVGGGIYLTTSQFGSNLYIGNNPAADGSYMSLRPGRGSPEFERLDATELAEQATGRTLSPAQVSSYWTGRTLDYITTAPGDWLGLVAKKARLLISRTELVDTESQESHAEYSWPLRWFGRAWHFGLLFPLSLAGAILLWPQRARLWVLYALTATYAISVIAFYVVARYRLPLVPLLLPFAATTVVAVWDAIRNRERAIHTVGLPMAIGVVMLAAVVSVPIYSADSQRAITENNLGTALQDDGRPEEAVAHYRRALVLNPDYPPALNNLGTALRAAGRPADAVAAYGQALAQGADRATVHINMGNALLAQGRLVDAIAAFRQAVAIEPRNAHAVSSLAQALYDAGTSALEQGDAARATPALREAVAVKPDYAEAHNNLGIALASQGRISEAIDRWREALRLKPAFADAKRNIEMALSTQH